MYRVTLVVANLGWVDLTVPLSAKLCWGQWEFGRVEHDLWVIADTRLVIASVNLYRFKPHNPSVSNFPLQYASCYGLNLLFSKFEIKNNFIVWEITSIWLTSITGLLFSLSVIVAMGRVLGDEEQELANSSDSCVGWWYYTTFTTTVMSGSVTITTHPKQNKIRTVLPNLGLLL